MSLLLTSSAHCAPRAVSPITGCRMIPSEGHLNKVPGLFGRALPASVRQESEAGFSVSGSAHSSFPRGAGGVASLNERQIIIDRAGFAPATIIGHRTKRNSLHLAGGVMNRQSLSPLTHHVPSLSHGTNMPRTAGQRWPMFTETELKEAVHPLVLHVLQDEKKRKGGKLRDAQEAVAKRLDGSARWLRRIIGRCPNAALHGHQMLNLVQLYIERNGDKKPIRALWKRVLKVRPILAQMRHKRPAASVHA